MHLKSLVLKGFKSFADKAVLQLEPGITAIVGPNGSGKSNISDAVLWVLGERSARNLRGQAMEDIIFSGSAARKAVSVAEVCLVLDNSDGTLPVDFDEVAITRRMYRSGESEYLINDVVARRMDVLDILHDTGLGTGTHSIISQGSLDSILQSHPEDRRALIEEAAGILKHKQRKEKSARKIERMDNHLDRVRDVVAEIQRQLGPLERKAKRAEAYKQAKEELDELRLSLAVDDLRRLRSEWEKICSQEEKLQQEAQHQKSVAEQAEHVADELQDLIRRSAEGSDELARVQRRAESVAERLNGVGLLMRERRRAALDSEADMHATLEGYAARKESALADLTAANGQLDETLALLREAQQNVGMLETKQREANQRAQQSDQAISQLQKNIAQLESEINVGKRKREELQEGFASQKAQERVVEARRSELVAELEQCRSLHEAALLEEKEAQDAYTAATHADKAARENLASAFSQRDAARTANDEAHGDVRATEAEIGALERAQKAQREDDPALSWLLEHAASFEADLSPVAQAIRAPLGLEPLLERLLGSDVEALSVSGLDVAAAVSYAVSDAGHSGMVSLVTLQKQAQNLPDAHQSHYGHALVDDLVYPEEWVSAITLLLGDIVLCANKEEAFAAAEKDTLGCRYATADGLVVYPQGKVTVFGFCEAADEGILARERHLADLRTELTRIRTAADNAETLMNEAEQAYRDAQAESLKTSEQLAVYKGALQAAQAEVSRRAQRVASVRKDLESVSSEYEKARDALAQLEPDLAKIEESIAAAEQNLDATRDQLVQQTEEREPLKEAAERLTEQCNEARLQEATLSERSTYAERLKLSRERDLQALETSGAEAKRSIAIKQEASARAACLLASLDVIAESLGSRIVSLDNVRRASESEASDIHTRANEAREQVRRMRSEYDLAANRMSEIRIEKGKLEVQVEAAVTVVTRDCSTPLDHIDSLPLLEDRAVAEDAVFRLERRIKNMGTINPDAAEEYATLKQRYDFLASQLQDMADARKSLNRISRVIDQRMKDDFAATFMQVNKNFSEIFSVLFPGGSAQLVLSDPDDPDTTGVEVTAQPRGKRITKMMLMSGGEKSLTALALLFAVYRTRSTPFYILDEVEAALDDTNLRRLVAYINQLRDSTQLIMITHQRRTMEMADVLFGVSMQADGVTKVISQKLGRALQHAE